VSSDHFYSVCLQVGNLQSWHNLSVSTSSAVSLSSQFLKAAALHRKPTITPTGALPLFRLSRCMRLSALCCVLWILLNYACRGANPQNTTTMSSMFMSAQPGNGGPIGCPDLRLLLVGDNIRRLRRYCTQPLNTES
jgi:hypothetical protein